MNAKIQSQICTTKEQSQRLLELGLKPETADCFHWEYAGEIYIGNIDDECLTEKDIPAWSLHRLIEILDIWYLDLNFHNFDNAYEQVISYFEERVKGGFLNKEYLKQ